MTGVANGGRAGEESAGASEGRRSGAAHARVPSERWREVDALLQRVLDHPPAERAAFLDGACGADVDLRREIESLLEAAPASGFLERPAVVDLAAMRFDGAAHAPSDATPTPAWLAAALRGRYVVERVIGRGGMATVYLGTDPRHHRKVALKVLHPELSATLGAERFLKEIELTAGLQHPHVLPLFDSGSAEGLLYYVMPYVEGETLRARLARERQLPIDDALRIARDVADALAYAHARGVIHRDVKPENVLLQGRHALVADFGIALAVEQAGGERMTRTGLSVGTPQYMAPEQAAGERSIDGRVDVYALGAVLYEMLAGEPPFTGATAQAVVARVLSEEPASLAGHRRSVPPYVDAAVRTALEKLPADRFANATEFAGALALPAAPRASRESRTPIRPRGGPATTALLVGGALAAVTLGWVLGWAAARPSVVVPAVRGAVRFAVQPDSGALGGRQPAISPDGRTVVFSLQLPDGARLYARRLDELTARPLAGTEDADRPFFSPDGEWVAFYSHGAVRKVRLDGGRAVVVAEVRMPTWFAGGSWGEDGSILFGVWSSHVLYRVPAAGGAVSTVAVADTTLAVMTPQHLPGGRAVLVTTQRADVTTGSRFGVLELASGRVRQFGEARGARYVAGHVLFVTEDGALYRQRFDLARLVPTGQPEQIASGLAFLMDGVPFDASPAGALVYRVGGSPSMPATLRLSVVDRAGNELEAVPTRMPWSPRFSPDGQRIAYGAYSPGRDSSDLWITDLRSGTTERVTSDGNDNSDPQWSPDGKRLVYSAGAVGGKDLFVLPLDGGRARSLMRRPGHQFSSDWLRDGTAVLVTEASLGGGNVGGQDVWVQPMDGGAARPFVATLAREVGARASPDGRWVAYTSDETGRDEVYVQSYPTPGRKTLVSSAGGMHPVWRGDGRELYYWQGDQLIAVQVEAGDAAAPLAVRVRAPLFRAPYPGGVLPMYDVASDGTRFVLAAGHGWANRLVVALDALSAPGADAARAGAGP